MSLFSDSDIEREKLREFCTAEGQVPYLMSEYTYEMVNLVDLLTVIFIVY